MLCKFLNPALFLCSLLIKTVVLCVGFPFVNWQKAITVELTYKLPISRCLRTTFSAISSSFFVVSSGRRHPVSVIPAWPEVEVASVLFLHFPQGRSEFSFPVSPLFLTHPPNLSFLLVSHFCCSFSIMTTETFILS